MLDRAEAGGLVPGIVHIAGGTVHHGVHRHLINIVFILDIGGDIVLVELLISGHQVLIHLLDLFVGHGDVLRHHGFHLVEDGVTLVALAQAFRSIAGIVVIFYGLLLGGGLLFLRAFVGQLGMIVAEIVFNGGIPIAVRGGLGRGGLLLAELVKAKLLGLLHQKALGDNVFQRHGAEQLDVLLQRQVVVAAVAAYKAVVGACKIAPDDGIAVDGCKYRVGRKLGGGDGRDGAGIGGGLSGGGVLRKRGGAEKHACAQQQRNEFLKL